MIAKTITEMAIQLNTKYSRKNYFIIPEGDLTYKSFHIKNDKVYIINNFDLCEQFHINAYPNILIENLYIFKLNLPNQFDKIKVEIDYLLDINSIKNYIIVIGISRQGELNLNFYNDSNLINKFTTKLLIDYRLNSIQTLIANLNTFKTFQGINECSIYKSIKINEDGLLIILTDKMVEVNLDIKYNILIKEIKNDQENKIVNCVNSDKYKFILGCSDNTIKIFSFKTKEFWYNLLGGSMTVIPKSFVAHPNIVGFSNVIMTKSKIIGSIGNLIREFSFIQK